jgi:hypothetical protein
MDVCMTGLRDNAFFYIFILFFLTLFFFSDVIFSDATFIARDIYLFYNPRQFYAAESINSGILPLWNPYVACGVPFQANLQSALFYPFNVVYYVLPFQKGFKYFIVLHYFLGALFMFLLMRGWGTSNKGSFLAGIVFAFGGSLLSINDNVAFLAACVWLPCVLLCFHRALETGRIFYSILSGIAIAAQIFAGDASFYLLSSFIGTFLYALYRGLIYRGAPACSGGKLFGCFMLSWSVGLGLAAVQLIPFVEFATYSHRFPGLDFSQATKWSYHPLEMLQLIIPYVFGTTVPGTRWFGQLWLDTSYVGIFPLIFVFVALAWGKEKLIYYLAVLLAVSLLLSFGAYTPVYRFLYEVTPVIKMVQYPVKFLFLAGFALAALAGKGLDLFFDAASDHKKANILAGVLGVGIIALAFPLVGVLFQGDGMFARFLEVYPAADYFKPIAQKQFYAVLAGCSLALTLCLLFALVCLAARKNRLLRTPLVAVIFFVVLFDLKLAKPDDPLIRETAISQHNETAAVLHNDRSLYRIYSLARFQVKGFGHVYDIPFERFYKVLKNTLRANLNIYEHIASVEEYSEILNRSFYDLFSPLESYFSGNGKDLQLRGYCSMLFNMLNVKYIISPLPLTDFSFKLISAHPAYIYENETVMPRAFFPQRIERFARDEDLLARIKMPGFDPRETACIISGGREGKDARIPENDAARLAWNIEWTGYSPQRCSLKTKTNKPGLLVVSDTYYPGWKAFVDGRESPLVKVNHFMRGVVVGQGDHEVLFVFQPAIFILGLCISAIMLCIVVFALIRCRTTKSI